MTSTEPCSFCGRRHRFATLVPNPDRPGEILCPQLAKSQRIMRLTPQERATAAALLAQLSGGAS